MRGCVELFACFEPKQVLQPVANKQPSKRLAGRRAAPKQPSKHASEKDTRASKLLGIEKLWSKCPERKEALQAVGPLYRTDLKERPREANAIKLDNPTIPFA